MYIYIYTTLLYIIISIHMLYISIPYSQYIYIYINMDIHIICKHSFSVFAKDVKMYRFSALGPDATSEEQLWKLGFSMEALVKVMQKYTV